MLRAKISRKTTSKKALLNQDNACDFDALFTTARPHILEKICLSLDYKSFKNCQKVNRAWTEVLTSESFQSRAKAVFSQETRDEEEKLLTSSEEGAIEDVRRILADIEYSFVNVDCTNRKEETPLYLASMEGLKDIVHVLIKAGADVNKEHDLSKYWAADLAIMGRALDAQEEYGQSPILVAASNGHKEVVQLLLDNGADPNQADQFGRTPLQEAADSWDDSREDIELVELLLDQGAEIDRADEIGTTPLIRAIMAGSHNVAKLLLDRGADAKKANINHPTPLLVAVEFNRTEMVELLLNNGADVRFGDGNGSTPMQSALNKGKDGEAILQLLFNNYKTCIAPKHLANLTLEEFLNYDSD